MSNEQKLITQEDIDEINRRFPDEDVTEDLKKLSKLEKGQTKFMKVAAALNEDDSLCGCFAAFFQKLSPSTDATVTEKTPLSQSNSGSCCTLF